MSFSKFLLKTLNARLSLRLRPSSLRLLSSATPEDADAERCYLKRGLPKVSHSCILMIREHPLLVPSDPIIPEFPEPLSGKCLNLHNHILALIRSGDLDMAVRLTRCSFYSFCHPSILTCNAVLLALLRRSRYSDLLHLHKFVSISCVAPNITTYNLLLQTYCFWEKTDTALEYYRVLAREISPVSPSPATYRILVKALVDVSEMEKATKLKDDMLAKEFCPPDPAVYKILMSGFVDSDPERVLALYEELKEKLGGVQILDGVVYGNLMKALFAKGAEESAMEVFGEVLGEGSRVRFDVVGYNLVLDALGSNGKLDEAIELFHRMCREHEPPRRLSVNTDSFNVMVDAYCGEKKFSDAVRIFRGMGDKECVPDTLSYNNLISHLVGDELVVEAEELYWEMDDPDDNTYVLLAKALVNVGRLNDVKPVFDLMLKKAASYESLGSGFCEAGRLDDAFKMVKGIVMEDDASLSEDMKETVEAAFRRKGREEEELGRVSEEADKEKAEARAAEDKARAEVRAA